MDVDEIDNWALVRRPVSRIRGVYIVSSSTEPTNRRIEVGKIVVSTNMTLDGRVRDPDGQEGSRLGGWFGEFGGQDLEPWAAVATEEALGAEALLLGRNSDAWFGTRWNERSGVWADKLNSMPKFVVSSTLENPVWKNSTVLRGDVVKEVSNLKQTVDSEILVYASYQLGRLLMEQDLVDELRLIVFPVVLGAGESLFCEISDKKAMRLASSKIIGEGLVFLKYELT